MSGDWGSGAAAAGGGRFDESNVKRACDWARLMGDTGCENDAAADDDLLTGEASARWGSDSGLAIGEADGGLAKEIDCLGTVGPDGKLVMAGIADDWKMVALCGSSWERETE